jgi:hypothetical protein
MLKGRQEKAMMALAPNVVSKKVYCVNLPQGLRHETTQVNQDKLPMEEDETSLD